MLDQVDVESAVGEVHALLRENCAGKSTLIKILTGALSPDSGETVVDGQAQGFRTPRDAQEAGIGVVYQDFKLFPHLMVAMIVYAAINEKLSRFAIVSTRQMNETAENLLRAFCIDIDARRLVRHPDAAERKQIEISPALLRAPHYLFLDEPTAALEPRETHRLLEVIDRLRNHGTGVILVTHRLGEAIEIGDRATALHDGRLAGRPLHPAAVPVHRQDPRRFAGGRPDSPARRTSPNGIGGVPVRGVPYRFHSDPSSGRCCEQLRLRVHPGIPLGLAAAVTALASGADVFDEIETVGGQRWGTKGMGGFAP